VYRASIRAIPVPLQASQCRTLSGKRFGRSGAFFAADATREPPVDGQRTGACVEAARALWVSTSGAAVFLSLALVILAMTQYARKYR
jgi:hypothetical protein